MPGYDYSRNGAYFVTICTRDRQCLFGEVKQGIMYLNELGDIAGRLWREIPAHYPQTRLGEYVVMPNHAMAWPTIRNLNH